MCNVRNEHVSSYSHGFIWEHLVFEEGLRWRQASFRKREREREAKCKATGMEVLNSHKQGL